MKASVIPYLHVKDAARAIEFYQQAFGATEVMRLTEPGGRIGHAEIHVGEARIMLADEYPEHSIVGPQTLGGTSVDLSLSVEDVDTVVARAVAAGAKLRRPVADQFYGERTGKLEDPFGHVWDVSTTIEKISTEEMRRRFEAMFEKA